jgi:predicted DsbA family dithiol-disulfide isomerase
MKKIEVFFDYNCPYCLKGHNSFVEFMQDKPEVEVVWHPCEIYERPQHYHGMMHTDICIQAMFFASQNGIDLWQFHEKMYNMIFNDDVNVENPNALVNAFEGFLKTDELLQALESGKYSKELKEANHYAFKVTGVEIVPTYRVDGGKLQDRQEFFGLSAWE